MKDQARKLVETARSEGMGGVHRRLGDEASRRGHAKRTAFAGAGGLLGGMLGSFRGPWGAALGGLLGALLGALLGSREDRRRTAGSLPAPRARVPVRHASAAPAREWIDVEWRG